jgi:hypothetical protein
MQWMVAWAALAALLVLNGSAGGADSRHGKEALMGLAVVLVAVEELGERERQAGYSKTMFQADVELKLRMAGIKVLSLDERKPGMPFLHVGFSSLARQPQQAAAFVVRLEFRQVVGLRRPPHVLVFADTWSVAKLGQGDASVVRDQLEDLVDQFINAWLSVNPKE